MKGFIKLLKEHTLSGHFVSHWRTAMEGVGRLSEREWIVSHVRKKEPTFFLNLLNNWILVLSNL